ncbi:MAG TPA: PEP/pyruvate-binding domain-containing protein [Acidimicrobiales bacterium]
MNGAVPLSDAHDESLYGAKAVGLGAAARAGLPVPPGVALAGPLTDAVASGQDEAIVEVMEAAGFLAGPLAVRSSVVDEDGAAASFAGQHLTLLNVPSRTDLNAAIREVWWSANSDSAISYRKRVGLFERPSVGVVVQALLDPDVAGVMFTQNPMNGADERVIEASWGLGEAVVAARVIPDHFRVDRHGEILERTPGLKKVAIRAVADGGTVEKDVEPQLVETLCLDDQQVQLLNDLATRCEEVYGPGRDIEWAYADKQMYLLQCRAVTNRSAGGRSAGGSRVAASERPAEVIEQVPLFTGLRDGDIAQIGSMFKERTFAAGETITKEGVGAAAFYVIESGEASVSIRGKQIATLGRGDYFGEIALIDEGSRSATVAAATDVVCHGLTFWEFRPLVQTNPTISWNLLQTLAKRLRSAQDS